MLNIRNKCEIVVAVLCRVIEVETFVEASCVVRRNVWVGVVERSGVDSELVGRASSHVALTGGVTHVMLCQSVNETGRRTCQERDAA